MTLSSRSRLGPYEIQSLLGAGGMGQVFKARDSRLDRTVAIKILPSELALDPDPRQRFEREARMVAALNHPHICVLYDVGREDGIDYLVLEYLEGPTLAERLTQGSLALEQALRYAVEIADALDKAHNLGITHRDLKPGNVMLTKSGAKLLDFGLARLNAARAGGVSELSALSTQENLTAKGTILGTLQYMAPEQLEGREADARTDLFAFGALLYEMLTGRKAFEGGSQASLIAAIMSAQPARVSSLLPTTPPAVDHLIRTCLAKDPSDRFQSAHDVLVDLKWIAETNAQACVPTVAIGQGRKRAPLLALAGAVAAAAAASLTTWWFTHVRSVPAPSVARTAMMLPATAPFFSAGPYAATNLAISFDGTRVAYVGTAGDASQIYWRRLNQLEFEALPYTENALSPFFSPDGEWIGFFQSGKLKKVRISGGPPVTLCDAAFVFGAAWSEDGSIVFSGDLAGGLSRVSAEGGEPQPFTKPAKGELTHRWPAFLPGGDGLLFAAGSDVTSWAGARIAVQAANATEHHILVDVGTAPRYAPTGHIVFARAGALFAVPFDRARMATSGPPALALEGVTMDNFSGRAQYALSNAGTLLYVAGGEEKVGRSLVWVDRQGGMQALPVPERGYETPRISPDGRLVALTIREDDADVWVVELTRGTFTRLTHETGEDESPIWTRDGGRVTYSSTRGGPSRFTFWRAADGSGGEEQIFVGDRHQHLAGWTPDGRTLFIEELTRNGDDVIAATVNETRVTRAVLETPFSEKGARLSPDGRFLAYSTNESGRDEVYVQALASPGARWPVSAGGGIEPVWGWNGRELFYRNGDKMLAVDIQANTAFEAAAPRVLFEGQYARVVWGGANYDVSPDGQRFLMIKGAAQPFATQLHLVLNWFEELRSVGNSQ